MTTLPPPIPYPLLETLLRQAPLDVLLFDTDLVCRYAAPAAESLFGQSAYQLLGQSAREIFSPENGDLHTALELAAQTAASYAYRSYRYTHAQATEETHFCWSVRIEPVLLVDYRGRDEFHGVLVTLTDIQDLADAHDQLEAEVETLRREIDRLNTERDEGRGRRNHDVREALAPVVGYLQLMSRRPHVLGDRSVASVIDDVILPGIQRAVAAVDDQDDA